MIKSQIRYAGYQYDEESDYYNLHARYYDPKTARFLQQDTYTGTIGDPLSLNLYTYCLQNPLAYWDFTGHWAQGDSDRPVAVQLALMKVSDDWLNAKTVSEKATLHKLAKDIRELGLEHSKVKSIIHMYDLDEKTKNLKPEDSERIIKERRYAIWQELLRTLEVVDKKKETEYLKKGYMTPEEWRDVRNVSYDLKFIKGSNYPKEIDVIRKNTHGIDSHKLYDSVIGTATGHLSSAFETINTADTLITGGKVAGWKDAMGFLTHYLSNSGTTQMIDFGRMITESGDATFEWESDMIIAMKAANDFAVEGKQISMVSLMEKYVGYNEADSNWLFTIGAYRTITQASFTTRNDQIYMDVNYVMKDVYDFHKYKEGEIKVVSVVIPVVNSEYIFVYDYELENLHRYGMAKEFKVVGKQSYTANFKKGFEAKFDQVLNIFLPK
jgi:RHS repeat-associated protein